VIYFSENLIKVHDDGGSGYIVDEEHQHTKRKTVPVVFHWEYGGKHVYLSGSFNNWKTKVPMTYRYLKTSLTPFSFLHFVILLHYIDYMNVIFQF